MINKTLSDEIEVFDKEGDDNILRVKHVKKHIQEAEKEIGKIEIEGLDKTCKRLMLREINKIFKKHFGGLR